MTSTNCDESLSPDQLANVCGGGAYQAGARAFYTAGTVGATNALRNQYGPVGRLMFDLGHMSQSSY
jgi:hypothetical protein